MPAAVSFANQGVMAKVYIKFLLSNGRGGSGRGGSGRGGNGRGGNPIASYPIAQGRRIQASAIVLCLQTFSSGKSAHVIILYEDVPSLKEGRG